MSDQALIQIAEAAEAGRGMPQLRVAAGNTLFVGTPGSLREFQERATFAFGEQWFNSQRVRNKKDAVAKREAGMEYGEQCVQPLMETIDLDGAGDALTLIDCEVWPPSGDGAFLKIVRVPLGAIDGWWPGTGELIKSRGSGGWIGGIGVLVPLDAGG